MSKVTNTTFHGWQLQSVQRCVGISQCSWAQATLFCEVALMCCSQSPHHHVLYSLSSDGLPIEVARCATLPMVRSCSLVTQECCLQRRPSATTLFLSCKALDSQNSKSALTLQKIQTSLEQAWSADRPVCFLTANSVVFVRFKALLCYCILKPIVMQTAINNINSNIDMPEKM